MNDTPEAIRANVQAKLAVIAAERAAREAADPDAAPAAPAAAQSGTAPATRLVAAPTHPMAVARGLVNELYLRPEGVVLRVHRGDFYHWDGRCWPEVDQRDVRGTGYQWLEDAVFLHPERGELSFAPSRRKIDDVVDALRAVVLLDSKHEAPTWTDGRTDLKPSEIVSMTNGLLHVPTRTLSPHTPTFFAHHSLPFAYLPMAPASSQWLDFLHQLWPDDASSISALQEAMGYVLGGATRLQKIFLFVGPKRGGKGTIARVLTGLLGTNHVACPTLASLSTNFGLAPLIGKPLAVISDARLSTRADSKVVVERLLSISGEDSLTIDRKFREPWTGRLPTRFCIFSNELPKLSDASGALASRFILFVLTKSFYGRENPRLTDELLTEAPSNLQLGAARTRPTDCASVPRQSRVRQRCHPAARGLVVTDLGVRSGCLRDWTVSGRCRPVVDRVEDLVRAGQPAPGHEGGLRS